MHRLLPPLCLLLALATAVAGFSLLARGAPEPSVEQHQAAAAGDDQYREALEAELRRQQLKRKVLLGCLFAGSGLLIVTAFLTMRPAESRRRRS